MQSAYYTAKPQEFPKIRIIKTMGPQKRTCNKQISILVVVGQIGTLENLGLEFGGGVISRFPK